VLCAHEPRDTASELDNFHRYTRVLIDSSWHIKGNAMNINCDNLVQWHLDETVPVQFARGDTMEPRRAALKMLVALEGILTFIGFAI
jgi:hypothetical protein